MAINKNPGKDLGKIINQLQRSGHPIIALISLIIISGFVLFALISGQPSHAKGSANHSSSSPKVVMTNKSLTMPNVQNKTYVEARAILENKGISVSNIFITYSMTSDENSDGKVLSTNPPAGEKIQIAATKITLTVAKYQVPASTANSSTPPSTTKAPTSSSPSQETSSSGTAAVSTMNLQQIQQGDYSSVQGTWKNANGDVIMFSGNTAYSITPDGEKEEQVIKINKEENGMLEGSIAGKNSAVGGAAFWFIPKGVNVADTDTTKDRIFSSQYADPATGQNWNGEATNDVMYKE